MNTKDLETSDKIQQTLILDSEVSFQKWMRNEQESI